MRPLQIFMRSQPSRTGFTLIELLIVVVIIGLLAAIAIPKFQGTRGRAFVATMQSDLKNLSTVQEDHYVLNSRYAGTLADLSFVPSNGITVEVLEGSIRGWSAKASNPSGFCVVYYGQAAPISPATREGVVSCSE